MIAIRLTTHFTSYRCSVKVSLLPNVIFFAWDPPLEDATKATEWRASNRKLETGGRKPGTVLECTPGLRQRN